MKFKITIEKDDDGRYVAECLDLPGCLSEGETLEEAIENINEAIIGCLKSRLKTAGEKLKIPFFDRRLDISIDLTGNSYAQASKGEHLGIQDKSASDPQHLPALQNMVNWIGNL
ncbi:type II toxin-antitoxin system HicB family antitoxin [Methanothrix soehngenii]|jgi:predicted RNase H-like HicB family nuclease|uniref:type II toxin-antitoxin system HicB family antitoxin n=1 Tax=Methanothrix soehngenii TaxID=2223 RepID=UPI0023F25F83|nr:type II toxin-antitoxin system HicB family antitoxin [Methanothrix soehngenii]MDD5736028.1 type II toxin-antitoxin system HicB family antitoxin [Methanothrix soehngenii]